MLLATSMIGEKTLKGNVGTTFTEEGPRGWTAFHVACFAKDFAVAEQLLREGVSVDVQDTEGRTALMYAAATKDDQTIIFLLSHQADPYLTDKFGKSALDYVMNESKAIDPYQTQVV